MSGTIFVTGVAGFIGSHVAYALLQRGYRVLGVDAEVGHPALIRSRLARLEAHKAFQYVTLDITNQAALEELFKASPSIEIILHFAARAGVRQSKLNPYPYIDANIAGHVSLLEACRALQKVRHIIYASSSAVYGSSISLPFTEKQPIGRPESFYAATKHMNELTAQTYAHLYGFPLTGLRFFTVYGPYGRPDMAYYHFARDIRDAQPVSLWSNDGLSRDFTYIDDVVTAILNLIPLPPEEGTGHIFNVGYGEARKVAELVALLEESLGKSAQLQLSAKPKEDVLQTWADNTALREYCSWQPKVVLEEGIAHFAHWFQRNSPI